MKKIIISILFITIYVTGHTQVVTGPSPVKWGSVQTYTYSGPVSNPVWQVTNCTINSTYGLSVTVTWSNVATPGSVTMFDGSTFKATKVVDILVPPGALTATNIGSTSFTANWTTIPAATSYRLDVSTSSSFSTFVSGYNNLTVTGTSQSVTGLTVNTTYYYRVRAYSSLGTTGNSNTITVGTGPTAPVSSAATNLGPTSFTANWGTVSGASGYRLDVSTTSTFSTFVTGYSNLSVSGTNQNVTDLTTSTIYYYRVRAVNSSGNPSSNSSTISVALAPTALPASSVTSTSFSAKWTAVAGVSSYRLYWSKYPNFITFDSATVSSSTTTYNVNNLTGSTTYYYRVKAIVSGASNNSNIIMVMNQNYVKKQTILKEGTTTQTAVDNLLNSERVIDVTIFDGLGRPSQQVTVAGSPAQRDIVHPVVYDSVGREKFKYLPYTSTIAGIYKESATDSCSRFYTYQSNVAHDDNPWSETEFDYSPDNKVNEQSGPGKVWKIQKTNGRSNRTGKTIRFEYGTNIKDVYYWTCDETNKRPIASSPLIFYDAKSLFRTRTYNENDSTQSTNWTEEYKDKLGNIVLKRSFDGTNILSTYYVYDDLGLLRYVLPPAVSISMQQINQDTTFYINPTQLDYYCYIYRYDVRHRMSVKKLPGADSVLMVYDKRDRLVAQQDGVQRAATNKEWLFNKYDGLNRPIFTGKIISPKTRQQLADTLNMLSGAYLYESDTTVSANHYYTCRSFPNLLYSKTYLTINYYDDHDTNNVGGADFAYSTDPDFPNNTSFLRLRNKLTVAKVRQVDPAPTGEVWYTTVSFYDKWGRVIQTRSKGIQGGSEIVTNEINFPGWLIKSKQTQTVVQGATSLTTTVLTRNDYDHQGRLLNTYHKINSGSEVQIANLKYNELGQLLTKKLHVASGTGLQKIDYIYNIRGWLKKINEPDLSGTDGDDFGMELLYNEGFTALNGVRYYNGNISGIKYKNANVGSPQAGYVFSYDQVNRLLNSKYGEGISYNINNNRYDENLVYDKNGNITKLMRRGWINTNTFGKVDSLSYRYIGNQVCAIRDSVPDNETRGDFYDGKDGNNSWEYLYDKNGNMIRDRNKHISISYNYLNLPSQIQDTISPNPKTEYVYTSGGQKIKQRLSSGTTLLYFGHIVYSISGTDNIAVQYIITTEGRAVYVSNQYSYEYSIKDHLGSSRVSFRTSGITQTDDYYPFGMKQQIDNELSDDNKYLYNGKEIQEGQNVNWYDYGARFYDPQIGRWNNIDKNAQCYDAYSPYTYALNTPINAIDPDGQLIIFVNGFMTDQWMQQNNNKSFNFSYGYGAMSGELSNPNYKPYPPTREFTRNSPQYLGKSFNYWGNETNPKEGIGGLFSQAYNDYNTLYISGSSDNQSQAKERFNEGVAAAKVLIDKLENGEISLNDGETIKIIGHSQGAAFAAGLASELAKNQKYSAILEAVHYLAPHQPGNFQHPSDIDGTQWSTKSDFVASKWTPLMWLNGGSELMKIQGIKDENYHVRNSYKGGRGGHSANTYLNELAAYYRSLGIKVTVIE